MYVVYMYMYIYASLMQTMLYNYKKTYAQKSSTFDFEASWEKK